MKKIRNLAFVCAMVLTAAFLMPACKKAEPKKDIVIIFTNDIHGGIDENVTLAGVAALKARALEKTENVLLVDCGDAVQGNALGTVSSGLAIVEAMNAVGYDFCAVGNHEFDYKMDGLKKILDMANATYLNCNIVYSGSVENALEKTKPYEIVDFQGTKVALIGISTPSSISTSTPKNFRENDENVYSFYAGSETKDLWGKVQETVDEVRAKGADYVIVLGHLGEEEEAAPYRSVDLIENTTGIDVVLDGHSHSKFVTYGMKNKDGKEVLWAQTGTKLESVGQLVISPTGMITVGEVSDVKNSDEKARNEINEIISRYSEIMDQKVADLDFTLSIKDENGIRVVRSRETGIGNLCADAFCYVTGADIAYENGGAVRASLEKGEISFRNIFDVLPFGNEICMVEITGQQLADVLEYFYRNVQSEYAEDGKAVGEEGSFGLFANLKCTIHTSVETSIEVDADDMLVSVGDRRRVSDIMVKENGEYVPLDPDKVYTLAASDYMVKSGGDGMGVYLKDLNILLDSIMTDYQALYNYITIGLRGDLSQYQNTEGRITVTD